jgi:hypothetical protein
MQSRWCPSLKWASTRHAWGCSPSRQVLAGPGGRRIDGDYRVTVFDPPRRLEFHVIAGPARPVGVFELTENPDQNTRVRFALDLKPAGLMKFMTPMITRRLRHAEGRCPWCDLRRSRTRAADAREGRRPVVAAGWLG